MLGTEVQKGVLGAYLFIIFALTCQYDQLVGVCSGRLKGGVLMTMNFYLQFVQVALYYTIYKYIYIINIDNKVIQIGGGHSYL